MRPLLAPRMHAREVQPRRSRFQPVQMVHRVRGSVIHRGRGGRSRQCWPDQLYCAAETSLRRHRWHTVSLKLGKGTACLVLRLLGLVEGTTGGRMPACASSTGSHDQTTVAASVAPAHQSSGAGSHLRSHSVLNKTNMSKSAAFDGHECGQRSAGARHRRPRPPCRRLTFALSPSQPCK